ncbi:MAG: hypothetical protein ACLP7J_01590 [Streptosporangiaceae bacterium]|jgi:hypothetical protein
MQLDAFDATAAISYDHHIFDGILCYEGGKIGLQLGDHHASWSTGPGIFKRHDGASA